MSEVTRSMEATSAVSAAYAERRRRAAPSGWWGVALLIATEATLFGCLISTYFYLAFQDKQWPPAGVPEPKVALPLVLTAALVATSAPMALAVRSARLANVAQARLWVLLALLVQGAYFGIQMHEFLSDLDKFSPSDSAYGSIYFTLIGTHHAHVALGILLNLWLLGKLLGGLTNYRLVALRVIALYWYFVSAAAVCVVLTQIYPAL
jgi:cytochrome c oxidase subunit 3/cytochrome c oxidase subunit I+III